MMRRFIQLAMMLPTLAVSFDLFGLWIASSAVLVDMCGGYHDVYDLKRYIIGRDIACAYLIYVRDPEPHELLPAEKVSLLTYGLTHHVHNGATNEGGSRFMIEHFLKPDRVRRSLSALENQRYSYLLYKSIRERSPDFVQLMLRAGSDPRVCLHVPSAAVPYNDALGYIELLRMTPSEERVTEHGDAKDTDALLEIERLIRDHLNDDL